MQEQNQRRAMLETDRGKGLDPVENFGQRAVRILDGEREGLRGGVRALTR